jgi:hypothetical protein
MTNVTVETMLGAKYVFPDVGDADLKTLPERGRRPDGALQLLNVSLGFLSIPWRIVKCVTTEAGEVLWDQ